MNLYILTLEGHYHEMYHNVLGHLFSNLAPPWTFDNTMAWRGLIAYREGY
jgi:hypothetical protein